MGGAGPGAGAGQGRARRAGYRFGRLLCPSGLWGEPGRWVAWHPGSVCAVPCSDLPSHGPPHTFQHSPHPACVCAPPGSFPRPPSSTGQHPPPPASGQQEGPACRSTSVTRGRRDHRPPVVLPCVSLALQSQPLPSLAPLWHAQEPLRPHMPFGSPTPPSPVTWPRPSPVRVPCA